MPLNVTPRRWVAFGYFGAHACAGVLPVSKTSKTEHPSAIFWSGFRPLRSLKLKLSSNGRGRVWSNPVSNENPLRREYSRPSTSSPRLAIPWIPYKRADGMECETAYCLIKRRPTVTNC